ncbi:MAG: hypothetical protein ABSB11_06310 [Sedimentisphaerales bacterium]
MKTVITSMLTLVLVAVCGCQSSSPRGGSVVKGEGFKIAVPTLDTKLKQGETQSVTVSLERGDYFKQDVKLQIEAFKGISVEPTSVIIKASDTPDVQIKITVPKDAALGEYSVSVKGIPKTGESTSTAFTVKVVSP